jgi:uncharacterized membrane protein
MTRGRLVVVVAESALIVVGLAFVVTSFDRSAATILLSAWDALACLYLAVGAVVVRRPELEVARPRDTRFNIAFTVAASVIGMTAAAQAILHGQTLGSAGDVFGVVSMVLSWLLLHAGFARLYHGRHADGVQFPGHAPPGRVDFLYFAYTIAVSFAVSDVSVRRSDTRWLVTVHSVISFFFNAAVIALAIGTITG